ncbi:uncharacterized [Tachysurus ichikawai]
MLEQNQLIQLIVDSQNLWLQQYLSFYPDLFVTAAAGLMVLEEQSMLGKWQQEIDRFVGSGWQGITKGAEVEKE